MESAGRSAIDESLGLWQGFFPRLEFYRLFCENTCAGTGRGPCALCAKVIDPELSRF